MKKLFVLLLAALVLSGCGKTEAPGPTQPDSEPTEASAPAMATTAPTEATEADTTTQAPTTEPPAPGIPYETTNTVYSGSYDGATLVEVEISGRPVAPALEGASTRFEDWDADYRYTATLYEDQARQQQASAAKSGQVFTAYTFLADYQVLRNDGQIFSILRRHEESTGGAHEMVTYEAESYLVDSGAYMTAADLFALPLEEARSALADLVLMEMDSQTRDQLYGEDHTATLADSWQEQDFCLTDTGVIFFWQVYAIAPYTAGPQLYELSYTQLDGIVDALWIP